MFKILTLNKIDEIGINVFKDKFSVSDDIKNPDGILLRSYNMHDMEFNDELLAIGRAGAGVNNIPIDKATEKGIVVFNTPGANANGVKELVIAALMLSSRKIVDGINWTKTLVGKDNVSKLVEEGKSDFAGTEIYNKKIGVLGLGAIGAIVANACHSLGMEVIGYDPFISVDSAWRLSRGIKRAEDLDELLGECDFITLHLPLIEKTKNMINKNTIDKMKDDVKILNFSRGELVNDEDIINSVKSKKISKYITDFPTEELLNIENIITIPHLGASTEESEKNCAYMAAKEVKNYLEFGNIKNSVNFPDCEMPFTTEKRICVFNENIPDVIGGLTKILSQKSINIEHMLNKSGGKYSYNIIDVSETELDEVYKEFLEVDGVIKVRII